MSKKEKLINRLKTKPKDFTYNEAKTLLEAVGFVESNKGRTSGSRVVFIEYKNGLKFELHKPHPGNVLKTYVILRLINILKEMGVI